MDRARQITTPKHLLVNSRQDYHSWGWQPALLIAVVALGLVGWGGAVQADTLNVANNGVDSSSCGATSAPCRSISQAIALASAWDRIVVGPGLYSPDLNENGILGEPGEENAPPSCTCAILIDKPLTLESRDGAGATVIDGSNRGTTVQIEASGSRLWPAEARLHPDWYGQEAVHRQWHKRRDRRRQPGHW